MTKNETGCLAEQIAWCYEKLRLHPSAHSQIKRVSHRGHLGFDIQSVEAHTNPTPRYIEVKTVSSSGRIFLTKRERANLAALGDSAWLYLVDTSRNRVERMIQNPLAAGVGEETALIYSVKV